MTKLAAWALDGAGVKPILPGVPAGVELMERSNGKGERVWILINHGSAQQSVELGAGAVDLLSAAKVSRVELAAHGVAVVEPVGNR